MMMGTKTTSRVLVVDDEPQVVWMLQFTLEAEGYQTLSAPDGRTALDEVREHHPNVVLLDIMMPVMDGYAFLDERRKDPSLSRIPVAIITAGRSVDPTRIGEPLEIISKPINVQQLMDAVQQLRKSTP